MERVWQRQYANHAEAKADITDYIVGFYNCKRINSVLGNLPPSVYEQKMREREPIVVSEFTWPPQDSAARCLYCGSQVRKPARSIPVRAVPVRAHGQSLYVLPLRLM